MFNAPVFYKLSLKVCALRLFLSVICEGGVNKPIQRFFKAAIREGDGDYAKPTSPVSRIPGGEASAEAALLSPLLVAVT